MRWHVPLCMRVVLLGTLKECRFLFANHAFAITKGHHQYVDMYLSIRDRLENMMSSRDEKLRLMVFVPAKGAVSETFIRAHLTGLPFHVEVLYGTGFDLVSAHGEKVFFLGDLIRVFANRFARGLDGLWGEFILARYLRALKIDAVLAEYGVTGSCLAPVCKRVDVPLFVHFHGFDAYVHETLASHLSAYRRMFAIASGIVAVSHAMKERLLSLGAPAEKIELNTYGVEPTCFSGAKPLKSSPQFLGVGRFIEKKAPHLTVLAFSHVVEKVPNATLTLVGEGPLLGPTKRLAQALGLGNAVTFLGAKNPVEIGQLMREARAFVQHSLKAQNGDSEGTPVAVIEAQMSGLPVVATRHAGIPDVVLEGRTGFLVDEGDAQTMGLRMLQLAQDPGLAEKMGMEGQSRARRHFTLDRHLSQLAKMIEAGVCRKRVGFLS